MKRTLFAMVLLAACATPAFAQSSNEFGILVGGSRRFVDADDIPGDDAFLESNFALSNNSVELYWSMPIEPGLNLRFKGGRISTQIAIPSEEPNPEHPEDPLLNRRDVEGEVMHAETDVEYQFSEPFGSSGLFAGLGFYRLSAPSEDSRTTWGVHAGVNADFPITRRYGVILEAAYHWTHAEFEPRYMTVSGGLRVSF
ncbi:MAG: hypothetical protein ABI779_04175 [Acidobacteriota bacterium]